MSQFNMQNTFFCSFFFLSSHHDTNPLLHSYHFRKKSIIIYWLILSVTHQGSYSAGPESKIGLSDVNVVCVYSGRGEGVGVRGFKMFCQRGSEFFLLALCVCGGEGGSSSVPLLP